jgi:hypothetical protein
MRPGIKRLKMDNSPTGGSIAAKRTFTSPNRRTAFAITRRGFTPAMKPSNSFSQARQADVKPVALKKNLAGVS